MVINKLEDIVRLYRNKKSTAATNLSDSCKTLMTESSLKDVKPLFLYFKNKNFLIIPHFLWYNTITGERGVNNYDMLLAQTIIMVVFFFDTLRSLIMTINAITLAQRC